MTVPVGFLDVNATVGRLSAPLFGSWLTAAALLKEMDRFHIEASAVVHSYARELDATRGNVALLEELAQVGAESSRLIPVVTLFPPHGLVDLSIEEQLAPFSRMPRLAVRIHPNPTHDIMDESVHARHYALVLDVIGSICESLVGRGVPLFLDMAEVRWEEIYILCREFPTLDVVILGMSYTHKRSLYAGLERYPNLHFEISGFHVQEGLEEAVRSFGPQQILFGSRLPRYTAASAVAMVQYAEIEESAKALIRGGNAWRLLTADAG